MEGGCSGGGGVGVGGVSGRDIGIVKINRQQPPAQAVQVSDSATNGRRKKAQKHLIQTTTVRQNIAQVGIIWRAKHQISI